MALLADCLLPKLFVNSSMRHGAAVDRTDTKTVCNEGRRRTRRSNDDPFNGDYFMLSCESRSSHGLKDP